MKFVARKDIANNWGALRLHPQKHGLIHPNHIHKGCEFEIGTAASLDLFKPNGDEYRLVQTLFGAEAIVAAEDTRAVARIKAEVADERARLEVNKRKAAEARSTLLAAAKGGVTP